MKRIYRFLIGAAIVLLSIQAHADGELLHIWLADGTTTTVQLFTRPQVTFEGNLLKVTSSVQSLEFQATDVLRFTYSGINVPTDVQSAQSEPNFRQDGESLYFYGNVTADKIALYTSDGKAVPVRLKFVGTAFYLPLSALPQGVYVLNVNGKTSKIVRK